MKKHLRPFGILLAFCVMFFGRYFSNELMELTIGIKEIASKHTSAWTAWITSVTIVFLWAGED